jgi:hypothetical protein
MLGNQQQCLHRGLPFFGVVFGLGQFGDVERGIAERDEFLALGQLDWIEKSLIPRHALLNGLRHRSHHQIEQRSTTSPGQLGKVTFSFIGVQQFGLAKRSYRIDHV